MYPLAGCEGDATGEGEGDGDGVGDGVGVELAAAGDGLDATGVCELARDVLPQAVSANSKTIVALLMARGIMADGGAGAVEIAQEQPSSAARTAA